MIIQKLESRQLLAANPLGATNLDTGEFFLGTVTVTPVFFESDGTGEDHTEDWTEEEIDEALAKISEGVEWWSDLLATITDKHTLDFVIDDTFARDPVETRFEPIANTSQTFQSYVGDFLVDQGFGDSTSVNHAALRFNDRQRNLPEHQTDWAFTIFMVDASDDSDGFFDRSGDFSGAFAYSGGLYVVTPNSRPASTIAHEVGHIFWARDEYPGGGTYTDRAGYYDSQNINAFDNPNLDQEPSIMRGGILTNEAYEQVISSPRTLELIGWRDGDGDGVFDLADVPLDLDITGYFDAGNSTYHVSGNASAVASPNQNSRSFQSDITLNEIDRLEYRLDGGQWMTAQTYGQQRAEIDVTLPIQDEFQDIEFRVIDTINTVANQEEIITQSAIIAGTIAQPALTESSIRGFVYIDDDESGERTTDEPFLNNTTAIVRNVDGSALFNGSAAADDFDGAITDPIPGVSLRAIGGQFNEQVYASEATIIPDQKVFFGRNFSFERFEDGWGDAVALTAEFDQSVGQVNVGVFGLGSGSYARLEAYDSAGNLLSRTTTDLIDANTQQTATIADPLGRIASVRILGHARTKIAISDLHFGFQDQVTTNQQGVWQFSGLAPGSYEVQLQSENLIHRFDTSTIEVQVASQTAPAMAIAATVVDSPRHNADLPFDVDQINEVTPADILAVINDLAVKGTRLLGQDETTGLNVDVNNDGQVSPLDVLLVINYLAENPAAGGQGEQLLEGRDSANTPTWASFGSVDIESDGSPQASEVTNSDKLVAHPEPNWLPIMDETRLKDGVLAQMFNSAGKTMGNESNSVLITDSQKDGDVFSESNDQTAPDKSVETPTKRLQPDPLTTSVSADRSALDLLSSSFEGIFAELKR